MTPTVESANFSVGRHKFDGRRRGKKVLHPPRDISEKALTVVELCDPGSELRLRESSTRRAKIIHGMVTTKKIKEKVSSRLQFFIGLSVKFLIKNRV